jgi:hypothetical protein
MFACFMTLRSVQYKNEEYTNPVLRIHALSSDHGLGPTSTVGACCQFLHHKDCNWISRLPKCAGLKDWSFSSSHEGIARQSLVAAESGIYTTLKLAA